MRTGNSVVTGAGGVDNYDMAILSALSENAELTTIELSKLVHLSRTAVARRMVNLRDRGIISVATVDIDYAKLGFSIRAYIEIAAPDRDSFALRDELLERPEVLNLSVVLGEHLLIAEVIAASTKHLHQLLTWISDRGYSETKVVLQKHKSRMAFRDRIKMIDDECADPDPRLSGKPLMPR